ncbi:MAG: peptidoglycan-associated lipoprotein Pal [bacterium]
MKATQKIMILALCAGFSLAGAACQKKGPVSSNDGVETMNVPLEAIHFDFDKYNIRADAQQILSRHSEWLKNNPTVKIIIEGNTDEWGTEEYNLALGERRAMAAKTYLSNLGISADRMNTISYGESRPVNPEHNQEAWAQNRRDDFKGRK